MNKKIQKKPLVSIILPVFKSEQFLEACLESLSAQSYKNIEIVAVVDYLGDGSAKILRKHKKIDKRLRVYLNLQRYGLASTLNRCVGLSRGEFIAFMDSTGIAAKSRISKQISYLINNPEVAVVGAQTVSISESGRKMGKSQFPLNHDEIYKDLISTNSMKFESVMIHKTRLPKDILKFKRNTHYPYIFVDVFLKIALYKQLANLDNSLLSIREIGRESKQLLNIEKLQSFFKLLFESTTVYEYKPSLKALFSPIIRQS